MSRTALIGIASAGLLASTAGAAQATTTATQSGYWVVTSRGTVIPIGGVPNYSAGFSLPPGVPAVGIIGTPDSKGYWVVTNKGNVYNFGDAGWFGSPAALNSLTSPVVGMSATSNGGGYWIVTAAGNVFNFGNAGWWGSPAAVGRKVAPIVGVSAAQSGSGYYVVTQAGNVFNFGNAGWWGSPAASGQAAGTSVMGVATDVATGGYWVASATGQVFSYNAPTETPLAAASLSQPVTSVSAISDGGGYRMTGADGSIFDFGDATFFGAANGQPLNGPIVGIAPSSAPPLVVRYGHGTWGYDISWPQCGGALPGGTHTIAVVGVTDGLAYTMNPCLNTEATWAGQGMQLYLNLNQASWSNPSAGSSGPAGTCATSDQNCKGYNYGWNSAMWAVNQAAAQGANAPTWWLDIELVPSYPGYWSADTSVNASTIQGAIAALQSRGITAGIYSTPYQWQQIAGASHPNVPVWYPTGANLATANPQSWCTNATSFAGQIWMIQGGAGQFDGDYAC